VINDIHDDILWCISNCFSFYVTFVFIYCFCELMSFFKNQLNTSCVYDDQIWILCNDKSHCV